MLIWSGLGHCNETVVRCSNPCIGRREGGVQLKRQGYGAYLPRYLKKRSHARRIDWVARPLFPCYLFVEMDVEETQWQAIRSTIGVSHFICLGELPVPVPDGIIEAITAREDEKGHVGMFLGDLFKKGQEIEIENGPMAEISGIFDCVDDKDRVFVLMNLLCRQVRVRVPLEVVWALA
jgi:transcriptional antiterminator RfaH